MAGVKSKYAEEEKVNGVNFTNTLVPSANALVHGVWDKRCHSVSPTELRPTLLKHRTRIYAKFLHCILYLIHHMLYASVVQTCRHSPHVATGHLIVATGSFYRGWFIVKKSTKLLFCSLFL